MAATLDIAPSLYAWLKTRLPAVGGRIYPAHAPQDLAPPYVLYQRLDRVLWGDQFGPDGLVSTGLQIDVYSRSRPEAEALIGLILGTVENPGVLAHLGRFPASDVPAVWVQGTTLDDDFEEIEKPLPGKGLPWFRQCVRLTIHHEQVLR